MTANRHNSIFYGVDLWTVLLYVLIVMAGGVSITSASYDEGTADVFSFSHFYMKQLMWIGVAWTTAVVVLLLDDRFYHMFAYPAYFAGLALLVGALLFGREESARVDDSGAEAPARRPVVPGTDVVAFVQRAGGAFGQVKRRDDSRIRRVGKERVLRAVARGQVLRPEGLRSAPLRDLLPGRWCRFPGYGGERAAQCSARRFLYRGFRPGRLRPELRGSARSQ